MKNFFFLFTLALTMGAVSSCQKENLTLAEGLNTEALSTERGGTVTGTSGGGTTVTGNWQYLNLCGQTMAILRETDKVSGQQYLTLADAAYNQKFKFQTATSVDLPAAVVSTIKSSFQGFTVGQVWQSFQPSTGYFLAESKEVPGLVLLLDKSGAIVCKGTK